MADNPGSGTAIFPRFPQKGVHAADVIDMAVSESDGADGVFRPAAQSRNDLRAVRLEAGIEQHQAIAGLECDDVRKRLDQRDPVREFGQFRRDFWVQHRTARQVFIQDARGQRQKIGHHSPLKTGLRFSRNADRLAMIRGRMGQRLQARGGHFQQQRIEPRVTALDQQALGHSHGMRRINGDAVRQCDRRVHEVPVGHDARDEDRARQCLRPR